ncbi:aldo/keto reductase [Cyanobium sp. Morenito 9A2]|uniref:aldo/keto reductase n=1 Tax=Cyanobium sp. Morenito 9A2 TaxID=2823718 RepID=UPI0020CD9DE7|nr:aldo/keto reductase [Cyanobium sp. Morenito 9A2]MCP9850587.1 aldo/keto reductase [Cyanobium sp. Morenito 9A2]
MDLGAGSDTAKDPGDPGIGVGTWSWGNRFLWGYEPETHDPTLRATFERAVALGLRFFDTADSYGTGRLAGRSERLLGAFAAALPQQQRQELLLATKLAPYPWRLGRGGFDHPLAASRQRLGGQIDRVQLHWSTARYAPWQEGPLLDGLARLVSSGGAGSLGLSNFGPQRLRWAHERLQRQGVRLLSLQVQLSLLAPAPILPGGVVEVCRELGIQLIAYSPFALGLLTEGPATERALPKGPRGLLFRRLRPRIQPLLEEIERLAGRHQASAAQVALNWCRSHGAMPIPGLRTPAQVEDVAAARRWRLSAEDRERLDGVAFALGASMPANPFTST